MPPRESSQNSPMNWNAMKKNANSSCRISGSAATSSAGAWKIARIGEVSRICPATTANSASRRTSLMSRERR